MNEDHLQINYLKSKNIWIIIFAIAIGVIFQNSIYTIAQERNENYELREEVIQYAEGFIGKPYVFGVEGPDAFDCSGLTKYVYKRFNIDLPHYTGTQWGCGEGICKNELMEGDLVFFNTTGNVSHVGIYIGGDRFIHAPSKGNGVKINSLKEKYYKERYIGARRMI